MDVQKKESNDNISRDKAIEYLFANHIRPDNGINQLDSKIFDKYGNYCFPTGLTIDKPNLASGTYVGVGNIYIQSN